MKKLIELKDYYPKQFPYWMTEYDIKHRLDDLWTSRETMYLDSKGFGTPDIEDAQLKYNNGSDTDECTGYFYVHFGKSDVKVYVHVDLYDWSADEKIFYGQSEEIVGWE